jgi:intein/homing endonuclease
MKLINQSHEILKIPKNLKLIEIAGRTCYQSQNKITKDSVDKFIEKMVDSGHHAMIEFEDIVVKFITNRGCCYDEKTDVLTIDGWKKFKDITLDDEIATLNPKDNTIVYNKPTKLYKYEYDGDLIEFKSQMVDLLVTPNHNMYFFDYDKRSEKTKTWKIDTADNIKNKRVKFKKNGIWEGNDKKYIEIPSVIDKSGKTNSGYTFLVDDFVEFLGYWVSDGHLDHTIGSGYKVSISQVKKKYKKKMQDCVNRMGFNVQFKKNYITFCSYSLFKYLEPIGKQPFRYIPKEFKTLPPNKLKILWDALVAGDGNIHKNGHEVYYTSSKKLADDLQEITLKMGYSSKIRIDNRIGETHYSKVIGNTVTHRLIGYIVSLNKAKNEPLINHNGYKTGHKKQYKGYIYCVNIPNHIIYVRRNRIPVWCGNSHELVRHRLCSFAQECIVGDTEIRKGLTIEELYNRKSNCYGKTHNKTISLRSVDECKNIIPNKMEDVFYKGVSPVYEVTTSLGYKIKSTKNHKFMVSVGIFKRLDELEVGSRVMVNGRQSLFKISDKELIGLYETNNPMEISELTGIPYRSIIVKLKKLDVFIPNNSYGYDNSNYKSGISSYRKSKKNINKCELCGSKKQLDVHHIDKDRDNNDISNLIKVCINCHKKLHHGYHVGKIAHTDKIESIEYIGEKKVYDIEMKAPYHNYIANGFVVHNSTRYVRKSNVEFIKPVWFDKSTDEQKENFLSSLIDSEQKYRKALELGWRPEQAREVLPNALKTEIVVKANIREWRHIFNLRCSKYAHPQIRLLMIPLLKELKNKIYYVFDDIYDKYKDM